MYEVEVKVAADHEAVRDRLTALGAEPHERVVQHDTYFDHPVRSFAATDEALRIRSEHVRDTGEERVTLTYKGPRVDDASKTREEVETSIGDAESVTTLLEAVNFTAAATVQKERERFALDGYAVTLDSVRTLGEFVEVETEGSDADAIETLRDGALALLSRLELDPDEQIRASYLELLSER